MLYSIWYRAWYRMSSHSYVYFCVLSFNRCRKNLYFPKIVAFFFKKKMDGCSQPCSLVNVLKAYLRWITTPFRGSSPICNYSYHSGHCMSKAFCHTPILLPEPKIFEGYYIWKSFIPCQNFWFIIPSFISYQVCLMSFSDIYVITHHYN